MRTRILVLFLSCLMLVFLGGCASTYGEKDLRSFESDYSLNIPTSPQYKLEKLSGDLYSITVHQGSPLFSPGYVRSEYLLQAASTIARDTCSRAGKRVSDSNLTRAGDSGWVHLQGTFTCGANEAAQEKLNYATSQTFMPDSATGAPVRVSDCYVYQQNLLALTKSIQNTPKEHQEEAREGIRELRQQAAAAGCLSSSGQAAPDSASKQTVFERALAECRWEIRQMTMGRRQPAYAGTGGFNDPQMGAAAANLAAAMASMPPSPAVMDECMAAKGFRK